MPAPSGVHVWLVLIKAFHALSGYTAEHLRESGLGDSDFRVLEVLLHKGAMPVNAIGPKVFLTPGSISTAVDRLHTRKLVTRVGSGTDRRVRVVDLTAKGRALIEKAFTLHAEKMEDLARVLTPSERAALIAALKKIGKQAELPANSKL